MGKKVLKSFLLLSILLLILNIITPIIYSYPKPVGYVNDFASIIDHDYEQKITQLVTDIKSNTSAEIAVVTIDSLEGESIENYAVKLFEEWGVGEKEKDNGLLILVALKERKYRIEVGYGLEGAITDSRAGRIGRAYLTPNFRHGDYGKGVYEAIQALKPYITGESVEEVSPQQVEKQVFEFFSFIALSIVYGIILFLYLKKVNKIKKKRRKKLLMVSPWIIPLLPLMILLFLLSFLLFITTIFTYISFALYVFGQKIPKQRRFGPFGGFGGGIGGFKGGGGGGFGGFGGGSSGGGGASGGW